MDRLILAIVGIVFAVTLVGLFTIDTGNSGGVTGFASYDACTSCVGTPVCGVKADIAATYNSACAARCDGARVIYQNSCDRIPQA